jgi:SAM-dependent methyltransferase
VNPDEVHRQWEERSGEFSPAYYAYYGSDTASTQIQCVLDSQTGSEPAVLELGCSSGRHLAHLHDHGYGNLSGIEINAEALDVMAESYPALAVCGTFYTDSIENVITEFENEQFDVVYSVETLQHLHPESRWVFEELSRITSDLLITVENEGSEGEGVNYVNNEFPLYYRDWKQLLTDRGFVHLESVPLRRDTLRVFRSR